MKQAVAQVVQRPSSENATSPSTSLRDRIERLLIKYPAITPSERQEIITFLRKGPHLDVGLLAGKDGISEKVAKIKEAHKDAFSLNIFEVALFLTFTLGPFVGAFAFFWR